MQGMISRGIRSKRKFGERAVVLKRGISVESKRKDGREDGREV